MSEFVTIISAIGALLTALAGFYIANSIKRKNEADAAESLTSGAMKMVEAKDKEIIDLQKDIALLRLYITYLLTGIKVLRKQVVEAQTTPCFDPIPVEEYKEPAQK